MQSLHIDLETYSSVDLTEAGVYAYTSAPDFQVLLFGYAWDSEPVEIVDLTEEELPSDLRAALVDPRVTKHAHNANFERVCLARYLGRPLHPIQWECSMVRAAMHGLPNKLEMAAKAVGLDAQKDTAGKALINYFCKPCKPTKTNGERTRNLPRHDRARWESFKRYCIQDVEVERQLENALPLRPKKSERRLWAADQEINDRGVMVDTSLVQNAITCDELHRARIMEEMRQLTGLENPNSVAQLKDWLAGRGVTVKSLSKDAAEDIAEHTTDADIARVLALRLDAGKTSVKKYAAMDRAVCPDGRIRGMLQFHGAGRTGRWTGRIVQVQNLRRNELPTLDDARRMLREGDFDGLELFYDSVPDTLSQLVRTAFIPSPGCRFVIADFSAIEARVIAWLAGEQWRMDVFNSHGKIYEASAAQMFRVPIEKIKKGNPEYELRQKGKIAELALGYQGAKGALIQMGALDRGLTEEELPELVSQWREANPNIVKLWYDVGRAAIRAVHSGRETGVRGLVTFQTSGRYLLAALPSGRCLCYPDPELRDGDRGKKLTYMGMEDHKWRRLDTYGGKLVENIVQGIARDCLAVAMCRLEDAGAEIVMHIHDEVVIDAPVGQWSVEEVCWIMGQPIPWAPGLPLRADGFETDYYMKD